MTNENKLTKKGTALEKRGRKKDEDPKQQVELYIRLSTIHLIGGKDKTREFLYDALDKEAQRIRLEKEEQEKRLKNPIIITDIHAK